MLGSSGPPKIAFLDASLLNVCADVALVAVGLPFTQALKSIKTSEFMPFVVFVAAPPVEILRNMHELALQRGRTNRVKTVSVCESFSSVGRFVVSV